MSFTLSLDFPKDTLILLDNVRFHHSKTFINLANTRGWKILYTPPYSPQYNPIELVFSHVKRHFRKTRNIEESFANIKSACIIKSINHVINKEIKKK